MEKHLETIAQFLISQLNQEIKMRNCLKIEWSINYSHGCTSLN